MEHAVEITKQNGRSQSNGTVARLAPAGKLPLHPMLQLQRQAGNQAVLALLRSQGVRAKLAIGGTDDLEEKQADEVADRVMRKPVGGFGGGTCTCTPGSEMCEACQNGQAESGGGMPLVRRSARTDDGASDAPSIVHQTLATSGRPLDPSMRTDMELRFGREFGDVRVHTDQSAAESAGAIDALAYA